MHYDNDDASGTGVQASSSGVGKSAGNKRGQAGLLAEEDCADEDDDEDSNTRDCSLPPVFLDLITVFFGNEMRRWIKLW